MAATEAVIIISADTEWQQVCALVEPRRMNVSPFGQWFLHETEPAGDAAPVVMFHGGWGKIAAAASAQYVIDHWAPSILINLGTCGGFAGAVAQGTIIMADRTLVYDIIEQMGDADDHIAHYCTELDLSWLCAETPQPVLRTILVSADRDLAADEIPRLRDRYGAVAGDWESGAIAWVAARNRVRCLILKGVTDLVGPGGGEAYDGNFELYRENTRVIMQRLLHALPAWLTACRSGLLG